MDSELPKVGQLRKHSAFMYASYKKLDEMTKTRITDWEVRAVRQ